MHYARKPWTPERIARLNATLERMRAMKEANATEQTPASVPTPATKDGEINMQHAPFDIARVGRALYRSGRFATLADAQVAATAIAARLRDGLGGIPPLSDLAEVAERVARMRAIPLDQAQRLVFAARARHLPQAVDASVREGETPEEAQQRCDQVERENERKALVEARLMAARLVRDGLRPPAIEHDVREHLVQFGIGPDVAAACARDAIATVTR
jgi:hypothetical protein